MISKGTLFQCQLCGMLGSAYNTTDPIFPQCRKHETGLHLWERKEREYKPRVIKFQIKLKASPESKIYSIRTIARWDKRNGLLVRLGPYVIDPRHSPDRLDQYWKATEANPEAVRQTIQRVGEYLSAGVIEFEAATELLDLLNQALARILPA